MSLTPPPPPPLRSDPPADFIAKAEAYLSWQQTFVTEIEDAIQIAGITVWVSGTTYAVGDTVWSPTDYRSYRRIIAGAGTTDPVSDTTNWKVVPLQESGSKYPCRVATTAAINLAAPGAAIDAATMAAGDRFLDKDNATAASRGVYIWNGAAVPATRAPDADSAGELLSGMLVTVSEGTVNADSIWMLTTNDPITIGTTALTFKRKDAPVASTADAQAFTDNTKIITALRLKEALKGSNQSLATSGYQKLPGGLIIQWGTTANIAANTSVAITLPIAFPNAGLVPHVSGVNSGALNTIDNEPQVVSLTATTLTIYNHDTTTNNAANPATWFAIGY